jgi:hypothetical protein
MSATLASQMVITQRLIYEPPSITLRLHRPLQWPPTSPPASTPTTSLPICLPCTTTRLHNI